MQMLFNLTTLATILVMYPPPIAYEVLAKAVAYWVHNYPR